MYEYRKVYSKDGKRLSITRMSVVQTKRESMTQPGKDSSDQSEESEFMTNEELEAEIDALYAGALELTEEEKQEDAKMEASDFFG